jgi:gp16 family phage-associated protein
MTTKLKTADEIKSEFFQRGETVHAWAVQRKFDPSEVYRVLNGQNKATKGNGHVIAVALGMKAKPKAAA